MDGVDQGIPFRGTLSLTMFRPGVQVLIDRNECRGELRSWRFRSEYARSPSEAILANRIIRTTPQETAERHSTAASANKPKRKKTRKLPIREWDCSNASARRDQSDNRDWYSILGSTLICMLNQTNTLSGVNPYSKAVALKLQVLC